MEGNHRALPRTGRLSLLDTLSPSEEETLSTQIATIREEIRTRGESVASCGRLLLLCPDVAISGQWGEIAKIAITEGWSFTFFPDGDVRFAPL